MTKILNLPLEKAFDEILVGLEPDEKKTVLLLIDSFIVDTLNIDPKKIPWKHETKEEEDFMVLISLMRLSFARVFQEYQKKYFERSIH